MLLASAPRRRRRQPGSLGRRPARRAQRRVPAAAGSAAARGPARRHATRFRRDRPPFAGRYRRYCAGTTAEVTAASRQSASELIDGLAAVSTTISVTPRATRGCAGASYGCRSWYAGSGIRRAPRRLPRRPRPRRPGRRDAIARPGDVAVPRRARPGARHGRLQPGRARRPPPTIRPAQPPRSPRQSGSTRTCGQTPAVTPILPPSGRRAASHSAPVSREKHARQCADADAASIAVPYNTQYATRHVIEGQRLIYIQHAMLALLTEGPPCGLRLRGEFEDRLRVPDA